MQETDTESGGRLEVIGSGRYLHSNVSGLVFDGVCFGSKVLYP